MYAKKEQCYLCRKEGLDTTGDNLVTFKDTGIKYCFRHGTLRSNRVENNMIKNNDENFIEGVYGDLPSRKIKKSVCEFYDYKVDYDKKIHIANYHDSSGKVVMQQIRTMDKKFPIIGDTNYKNNLWGLDRFTCNKNIFITITEGQIDAMSIAQVFDCKYPVVSLPNGCSNAHNVIRSNMNKLRGFKYVVLAFDSDKPGMDAIKECIKEFEPGEVRIARFRRKDANEHLINGEDSEIRQNIYNAVEYMPPPVLTGDNLLNRLNNYTYVTKLWPFKKMNELFNPIKVPSVISVVSKPKRGKTEFMAAIARFEISNGGNIAIISLEQSPEETFLKQVSGQIGENLCNLAANRCLNDEERSLCEPYKNKIVIYDHVNYGQKITDIIDNIPYMVKTLKCQLLIFDNLTSAISSTIGDDRKNIDKSISDLKALTIKYNFTLFNIMHLKRNDNHTISEEDEQPNVEQIRGTQGIEAFSDCVIGLHRNIRSQDMQEKNTLYVTVLADRMPGNKTGNQVKLIYNQTTGFLED